MQSSVRGSVRQDGYMGDGVILTVYSILAGLVFLAVGLFLFEKYAEI